MQWAALHCCSPFYRPNLPMLICDVPQIEPYPLSLYCTTCRTVPLSCRPCYNSVIFFTLIFLSPSVEVRSLLYPYKHPRTTIFTFLHKVRPSSAAAADIAHVIISDVFMWPWFSWEEAVHGNRRMKGQMEVPFISQICLEVQVAATDLQVN